MVALIVFLVVLAFVGWLAAGMVYVHARALQQRVTDGEAAIEVLRNALERATDIRDTEADARRDDQANAILDSQQTIAQALSLIARAVESETEKIRLDQATGMSLLSAEVSKITTAANSAPTNRRATNANHKPRQKRPKPEPEPDAEPYVMP